jgi:hypothetical protein
VEARTHHSARGTAQVAPEEAAHWLCFERDAVIVCPECQRWVQLSNAIIINAESLAKGLWALYCNCGHVFTVADLVQTGAIRKRGREAIKE